MANFKENYHFQGSGRGPTFSRGGGLFPIETHITCDFPGGSGPPVPPPLDPHLSNQKEESIYKGLYCVVCTKFPVCAV